MVFEDIFYLQHGYFLVFSFFWAFSDQQWSWHWRHLRKDEETQPLAIWNLTKESPWGSTAAAGRLDGSFQPPYRNCIRILMSAPKLFISFTWCLPGEKLRIVSMICISHPCTYSMWFRPDLYHEATDYHSCATKLSIRECWGSSSQDTKVCTSETVTEYKTNSI
jgi:hypothetical protein